MLTKIIVCACEAVKIYNPSGHPKKYIQTGARARCAGLGPIFVYTMFYILSFFNLKKANFFSISPSVTPDKSFTSKCLYFQRWTIEVASHRCPELAPLYNRRDQWPWTVYLNIHHLTKTNNSARWCARNLLQTDGLRMTWPCAESNRWWNRGWD